MEHLEPRPRICAGSLFCFASLAAFSYSALLLLSLVLLNPLFVRRPGLTFLLVLAATVLGGIVFIVLIRLLSRPLDMIRLRHPERALARIYILMLSLATLSSIMLPITFSEPVKNLRVLAALPAAIIVTAWLFSISSRFGPPRGREARIGPKIAGLRAFLLPGLLQAGIISWSFFALHALGKPPRLIVIGIDGASYGIIERMSARGELPTFAQLAQEGASGRLASIDPCLSPAVWTSISTGFLPESHGITNFNGTLDKVKKKGFWEILSGAGYRIGVFRWLVTWPPIEVNGFLVPNWLARDSSTWPPALSHLKRVRGRTGLGKVRDAVLDIAFGLSDEGVYEILGHKARASTGEFSVIDLSVARERVEAIKRRDFFLGLWRLFDFDYGSCVFDGVDAVSHTLWQYMEPGPFKDVPADLISRYGGAIEARYRELDRLIGDILETLGEETYVLLISDHGFRYARTVKTQPPKPQRGVLDCVTVPTSAVEVSTFRFDRIFIGVKEGDDAGRVAADLERQLGSIVLEGEDEPLLDVERIGKKAKSYESILVVSARNGLEFLYGKPIVTPVGKREFQDIFTLIPSVTGEHDPADGIFFFTGPGVRKGALFENLSVLDIHPLVLHLFSLEVPRDIDGTPRMDLFEEGALPEPRYTQSYGERDVIVEKEAPLTEEALERMKALGYIE